MGKKQKEKKKKKKKTKRRRQKKWEKNKNRKKKEKKKTAQRFTVDLHSETLSSFSFFLIKASKKKNEKK